VTPTRVLFVEANEDGSVGGSHQVLFDMVRSFDSQSIEPLVLFYQANRFVELFRSAGIEVLTWDDARRVERERNATRGSLGKLAGLWSAIGLRVDFLRRLRVDLVHLNNSPRSGRDDWLPAARRVGVPIVASARGDADPLPGRGPKAVVGRRLMRLFDRVIAVSGHIADAMRAQGIPPERIVVVHDGVDRTKLEQIGSRSAEDIRSELDVPEGRMFVAAVGNIREWKGQHVVLNALSQLAPEDRARLCVVFVGAVRAEDEHYYASLQRRVAEEGLSECVRFAGPRTDVPDILATADAMVHSSVLAEPGGTVVIEAMTFGAPVVVASKGGHLDYLTPDLGLVHDVEYPSQLARHLVFLADHPEERLRMSRGAQQRAAEFSIERTALRMQAVYDDLTSPRKSCR
jgi:glycosyltransferase involved in cell wall biosynthesis